MPLNNIKIVNVCIVFTAAISAISCNIVNRGHAVKTMGNMITLSMKLEEEKPNDMNELRNLETKGTILPAYFQDAWGNRVKIDIWKDTSRATHYRITSYGSDGLPSKCCIGRTDNYELDAVLEEGEWKQFWNTP